MKIFEAVNPCLNISQTYLGWLAGPLFVGPDHMIIKKLARPGLCTRLCAKLLEIDHYW